MRESVFLCLVTRRVWKRNLKWEYRVWQHSYSNIAALITWNSNTGRRLMCHQLTAATGQKAAISKSYSEQMNEKILTKTICLYEQWALLFPLHRCHSDASEVFVIVVHIGIIDKNKGFCTELFHSAYTSPFSCLRKQGLLFMTFK